MPHSPIANINMIFDTLTFAEKMHKAGMTETLAKQLAYQLRDINNHNFGLLLTKDEFKKFENEVHQFKSEFKNEIEKMVTKIEFKNEIEKMVTKIEFNEKIKNLELAITIKLGFIMVSGITILGLLIKM
jgi:hypothetical protein